MLRKPPSLEAQGIRRPGFLTGTSVLALTGPKLTQKRYTDSVRLKRPAFHMPEIKPRIVDPTREQYYTNWRDHAEGKLQISDKTLNALFQVEAPDPNDTTYAQENRPQRKVHKLVNPIKAIAQGSLDTQNAMTVLSTALDHKIGRDDKSKGEMLQIMFETLRNDDVDANRKKLTMLADKIDLPTNWEAAGIGRFHPEKSYLDNKEKIEALLLKNKITKVVYTNDNYYQEEVPVENIPAKMSRGNILDLETFEILDPVPFADRMPIPTAEVEAKMEIKDPSIAGIQKRLQLAITERDGGSEDKYKPLTVNALFTTERIYALQLQEAVKESGYTITEDEVNWVWNNGYVGVNTELDNIVQQLTNTTDLNATEIERLVERQQAAYKAIKTSFQTIKMYKDKDGNGWSLNSIISHNQPWYARLLQLYSDQKRQSVKIQGTAQKEARKEFPGVPPVLATPPKDPSKSSGKAPKTRRKKKTPEK